MRINKKLEKLIDITSSVSEQETNETCFINEINEEKYKATIAMAKALKILSENTIYETEIIELLSRCGILLDFSAEDIIYDEEPLKTRVNKCNSGLQKM